MTTYRFDLKSKKTGALCQATWIPDGKGSGFYQVIRKSDGAIAICPAIEKLLDHFEVLNSNPEPFHPPWISEDFWNGRQEILEEEGGHLNGWAQNGEDLPGLGVA